jgi:hypothetical protein
VPIPIGSTKLFAPRMEGFFGYKKSKIFAGVRAMVDDLYFLAIKCLDNPALFHHRMAGFAQIVNAKTGLSNNIWGFIDGTLRHTCWPTYHQKLIDSMILT